MNRQWINKLISRGIAAAHPENGWVDRKKNKITLQYPYFISKPLVVGSYMAIGDADNYRIVRIIGYEKNMFSMEYYYFRDTNMIPSYDNDFTKWWKKIYRRVFRVTEYEFWIRWDDQMEKESIFLDENITIQELERLCDAFARQMHHIHKLHQKSCVWAWRKIPT